MSDYTDRLSSIRAARTARDKARDELYTLQLKYLALTKEQKKFLHKDVTSDVAATQTIHDLQKQISDLQTQISLLAGQLQEMQHAVDRLQTLTEQSDALKADVLSLQRQITAMEQELADPALPKSKRNELAANDKALQNQLRAEQQRIGELSREIAALTDQVTSSAEKRKTITAQQQRLEAPLADLQKKLDTAIRQSQKFPPDKSQELSSTKGALTDKIAQVSTDSIAVQNSIAGLFAQSTPLQLIERWNDRVPIMLLPVRIETKYKTESSANQLWIRIFPDDVAVVTHEPVLTSNEVDAGIAHWKALWRAKGDAAKKEAAWTLLSQTFGVNRAAWVALQTRPLNWSSASSLTSENDLQFPIFDTTKPDPWTQAPHTRILPDKFVALGYRNGELKFTKIGTQVNDIVVLGPSPLGDGDNPSITRDSSNRLHYGDDFNWMVDFSSAVQSGLGFIVTDKDLPQNDSVVNGFDQLLVVGVKLSCDESGGKDLLEELLENHNYSVEGLSLLKQGTPTNNTEEKDSGYSKKTSLDSLSDSIEQGTHLFEYTGDKREATDGQRLAEYLGIEYTPLQLVPNSGIREFREAVAMNKALYASTLGYFTQSMLNEVMSDSGIGALRDHFTNSVAGRGPIAAIRVGNQPYGIIPTSAFSKWKYPVRSIVANVPGDDFLSRVYQFLLYLESLWKGLVPQLSYIHKQGDAGANLINVLGLNPTSVEYYQRVGYSFDYLKNLEDFSWGGKYFGDAFKMVIDQIYVKQILRNFGYTDTEADGTPKPVPLLLQLVFQHYHTRLDNNNLIDGLPSSEDATIKPYDKAAGLNYVDWLIANISDAGKLESQDFGGAAVPNSLLYMLLKNSLLLETSHSLYNYFQKNDIQANELIRSRKFMNITSTPSVSHWEVFQAPANRVVPTENSNQPLFEFIHSPQFAGAPGAGITENLDDFTWALGVLKDMSTAGLERAMAEHFDTLAYRLDAWQTSLFDLRLQGERNILTDSSKRNKGVYIGAYGYLENVKPSVYKRTKISEEILPTGLREGVDNLYTEANNGGYVQAPTLNHATAAAILRSGYLTHANPADQNMLSVNLSSERVRRAKYLVDGIRNGQTLEVLLGYQFERGLHDWTTRPVDPVILSQLIPNFRQAFPIKKTKVPQEGKVTGPEEVVEDYSVVNGLDLAGVTADFPYGITTFPSLTADQINAIKQEKDNIANTLDAMRDLLTSESAYQLALGNFDRAAAVMQAISDSHMPPDIQVIDSARGTDLAFTNRVAVHFDSTLSTNPWPPIAMTEKANTETGLNNWIGSILDDPANIRCLVKAVDKDGNELTKPDLSKIEDYVSLRDLDIQPIDFVYLIRNQLDTTGTSELEGRIRYFFARKNNLTDDAFVKIEFTQTDSSGNATVKSFAEILPLANALRTIVSGSRPLKARDYDSTSKTVTVSNDNPDNIKTADLETRVQSTFSNFNTIMSFLQTAVTDATTLKTEASVNNLRDRLKIAADAGMVYAFPQSSTGFGQTQIDALSTQGLSVLQRFDDIKKTYNKNLTVVQDANTPVLQKVNLLTEMIKSMLGADYVILPRFSFHDAVEINQSFTTRADLLQYSTGMLNIPLPVNEWLHGVSLVRPKMHTFEQIRMLNDTFDGAAMQLEPMQIPYRDKASWLAVEYPPDTAIDHDTISLVTCNPQGFTPAQDQCGLLVDEWVEVIPRKEEVTGISFNYNQPNSVPPQAILLAVTPEETGSWKWDNLTATILDTFDRAKRRAVEPDVLDQQNNISTLFPALLSEFSTAKSGISLDYTLNIQYVLDQVMTLSLTGK